MAWNLWYLEAYPAVVTHMFMTKVLGSYKADVHWLTDIILCKVDDGSSPWASLLPVVRI
jgi:hypothetical protein